MDSSDGDDDNYSHHYSGDLEYTTVHNANYTSAPNYNLAGASVNTSVNASVNASVGGSQRHGHVAFSIH